MVGERSVGVGEEGDTGPEFDRSSVTSGTWEALDPSRHDCYLPFSRSYHLFRIQIY
jgi:hypothetical protein